MRKFFFFFISYNVPITCPLQVNMIKDDGFVIHFTNPKGNYRNLLN